MELTQQELIFIFEYISKILFEYEYEYHTAKSERARAIFNTKRTTARLALNKVRAVIEHNF